MNEHWKQYAADFNAMSDEEINAECERCHSEIDEAQDWLDAVASWEAAGRPRLPAAALAAIDEQGE